MKLLVKRLVIAIAPIIDLLSIVPVWLSCQALKLVRLIGVDRVPKCLSVFRTTGIFPLRDHFYEPLFNIHRLKKSLRAERNLPGIDWNVEEQLQLLANFSFNQELLEIPLKGQSNLEFTFDPTINGAYGSGDAEYLYNIIRFYKPRRVLEIGSGNSTLLAAKAIKANHQLDSNYTCEHICIEPFGAPWLEKTGATIIRKLVEDIDLQIFSTLEKNDILFIDSSHIIRPQGDVLFEYLEVLPTLKSGVLVHIHDIFSPRDYLDEWLIKSACFWNEQYLVEAFMTFNREYKIIGALNYLRHNFPDQLTAKCPILKTQLERREPGSFWIQKI